MIRRALRTLCIVFMLFTTLACAKAQKLTSLTPFEGETEKESSVVAPKGKESQQNDIASLVTGIEVEKQHIKQGESVSLRITLLNPTNQAITVPFPAAGHWLPYFTVTDKNGNEIWDSLYGMVFTMQYTEGTLKPGETWTHSIIWDGRDNNGKLVPAGEYSVTAVGCEFGDKKSTARILISIE